MRFCSSPACIVFPMLLCGPSDCVQTFFFCPVTCLCAFVVFLAMISTRFWDDVTCVVLMEYVRRVESRRRGRLQQKCRTYWTHPMLLKRPYEGFISLHYGDLRRYPTKFYNFTRLTIPTFDFVFEKLQPRLQRLDTNMRRCVPPEDRLILTLRFLATGQTFTSLSHYFLLGISTISEIVHDTCKAIWEELRPLVMPVPDVQMWSEIADGFLKNTQFPNCFGALDGKHIRITMPPGSGSSYYNYKKYFSVVLMAICDSNYKFVAVDIGAYGSTADSRVFRASRMGRRLLEGRMNLPSDKPLPGTSGPDMPHVLVADEAFALSRHILRPYAKHNLNNKKRIFNYRLSRARRYIECTFGILSSKWRIFHRALQLKLANAEGVIQACCVLHNLIREKEGISMEDEDEIHLPSVNLCGLRPSYSILALRGQFADHFMSPDGEVPWQYAHV